MRRLYPLRMFSLSVLVCGLDASDEDDDDDDAA